MEIDYKQKINEAILGVAVGDAVGVPIEFVHPHILKEHPVTEMLGNGSHNQPIGTWSDDTSMTLALIDALSESEEEPDYFRIMENFSDWIQSAKYTSGGEVFDVGRTCLKAVGNFVRGDYIPTDCGPKSEFACGNGGLMRILPALFWCRIKYGEGFVRNKEAREVIHNLTSLTHGHEICLMASSIYLAIADGLLNGKDKADAIESGLKTAKDIYASESRFISSLNAFDNLYALDLQDPQNDNIKSSGYVVDSLEAALWAFACTNNYRDCILKSVNLGHDTDTVAAIAGGLAGIYYGLGGKTGIPLEWLANLKNIDCITVLCEKLADSFMRPAFGTLESLK